MNINSIRTARRMAVAASGMAAAITLVIGAGTASAGPVLSAANSPTKVSCVGSPKSCYVHDLDGIKSVLRETWSGTWDLSHYNGEKDIVVLSDKYHKFTVTDMRGFQKTYAMYA